MNPESGKIKSIGSKKNVYDILRKYGYDAEIKYTKQPKDATEIVRNLPNDIDLVISAGGDGTLNEVVTGNMARTKKLTLANLPMGTTNDVGHMYGLNSDYIKNLELILWDRSKRMATEIRGIIIENEEETITLNGEALQLCKITLTDEYETTNNPEVWFNLKEKSGEALHDVQLSSLKIYGADTEPMLHVFNHYSTSVQDDKLTLSEEIRKWGSDLSPFKNIGLAEGDNNIVYFAIKQGTEYCLVNDIDIAEEGLNIKDYDQSGAKCLEAEKAGSYTLNGMYNGKNYSTTLDVVKFCNFGYFKKPERAKSEAFVGRFAFDEAVEKNEAETEAYFYVIAEAGNSQLAKVSLSVSEIKTNPSTGHDFEIEQKEVEGIEIEAPYETDFDGIRCFIWKITVTDAFQHSNDDRNEDQILFSLENFDFRANDGNISGVGIHIVGKSESKIPGLGKFTGSGRIDAADALYLRRSLAGWENYKATLENADINQDGVIDKADVIALERHIAGWKGYKTLPVSKTQTESA